MLSEHKGRLLLYAPNVHTGGGLVLIKGILSSWLPGKESIAFLDERAKEHLKIPSGLAVIWVGPKLTSRFAAECLLYRRAEPDLQLLCFHGLPPLLPCNTSISVFVQNRLLIQKSLSSRFKWKTLIRVSVERFWAKVFRHRVARYIVQTPTMQREMFAWLADAKRMPKVDILPFVAALPALTVSTDSAFKYDFVYVADGEAHKNHLNLVAAWKLLAEEGVRPSLVLTLGKRDAELAKRISEVSAKDGLHITNLGQMSHSHVLELYANAQAMIFPSLTESFGLPLVEAAHVGLPILASELDYVRDVCDPAGTFDPQSPISIARAVKRHLGLAERPLQLRTAADFLSEVVMGTLKS
jgi:glycosyltransferase involved in cell wall biosynthesis